MFLLLSLINCDSEQVRAHRSQSQFPFLAGGVHTDSLPHSTVLRELREHV